MEPKPQPPGGQTNSHTPEPVAGQAAGARVTNMPLAAGNLTPATSAGAPRVSVQPSANLQAELASKASTNTSQTARVPASDYTPAAFKEASKVDEPPATTPSATAVGTALMTDGSVVGAVRRPSGRWQTFWYALSVLSLGLLFIATSTVTSQGTLEKLLVGLKPNPSEAVFGTPWNIILGYSMLSIFVVCLPLFIVSTVVVDRYRSVHPDMRTVGMKKLSYVFMVLASLLIVFQIATAIFALLYHTFDTINAISIAVNIAFMAGYFAWLFTLVAEDRS